jgi:hypothetical protein
VYGPVRTVMSQGQRVTAYLCQCAPGRAHLEKFFGRVNDDILMSRVARQVKNKRVLKLIRRYLEAGMMEGGVKITARQSGNRARNRMR